MEYFLHTGVLQDDVIQWVNRASLVSNGDHPYGATYTDVSSAVGLDGSRTPVHHRTLPFSTHENGTPPQRHGVSVVPHSAPRWGDVTGSPSWRDGDQSTHLPLASKSRTAARTLAGRNTGADNALGDTGCETGRMLSCALPRLACLPSSV